MSDPSAESAESRPIVITEIEQFGGAERSALALTRWLHNRGIPAHIVTYADHCGLAQYASHPLRVVELKAIGTGRRIAALQRYFGARATGAPRPLLSGYQPALHGTLAGMRGFHDLMHDTPSLFDNPSTRSFPSHVRLAISNRIVAVGLRSGGTTIVTSEFLRNECRKDFGIEARIARMGGLSSPTEFRLRPVHRELRMLSVCRVESNKRIDWILRGLAALEQKSPALSHLVSWSLDVVGKGPLIEPLKQLARHLEIDKRVSFHGFVPDSQLQTFYDSAHLFVMPAVQGYGIPAIESLQRGIPVLLHRQSGVSDILLDTAWATVFSGGEEQIPDALERAINSALTGRHLQQPLPELPTENSWAEQVAHLCGWVA